MNTSNSDYEIKSQYDESVEYIKKKINKLPEIAMIMGSGLGELADEISNPVIIKYSEIPNFPTSVVEGHKNQLVIGEFCGKEVIIMQGRTHYYEGYTQKEITYPVRVFNKLGIKRIIITNAAGGCNVEFNPGDLMVINDHINFSGSNPLIGANYAEFGPRFPDMSYAYDKNGLELVKSCASDLGIDIREGVYMYFSGPSYETPAEIKMAKILGADAVGMSTVPEVIVAKHCDMQVIGISCITNMAAGILDRPLNHEEVIETTNRVKQNFSSLIRRIVDKL